MFCKRRTGIAKKACELAILCDADIGIIIFSKGGKSFTIGSPNINHVINIYLDNPVSMDQIEDSENMNAKQLQLIELKKNLKREIDRHKDFSEMKERLASQNKYDWWPKDIGCFGLNQLLIYRTALEGLKASIRDHIAHETKNAARNSDFINNPIFQDPQHFNPNLLITANCGFTSNPTIVEAGQFNPNPQVAANSVFTYNPTGLGSGQFNPNLPITANSAFSNNPTDVYAGSFNPNPQVTENTGFTNHTTDVGTEQYNTNPQVTANRTFINNPILDPQYLNSDPYNTSEIHTHHGMALGQVGHWNPCMTERNQLGEANESITVEGPAYVLNQYAASWIQNGIGSNQHVEFPHGNSQLPIQSPVDNNFQQIRGPSNYAQHLHLQGMRPEIPTTVSGFGTLVNDFTTNSHGMAPTIPATVNSFGTVGNDSCTNSARMQQYQIWHPCTYNQDV